ncbi:MAG: TPR end-of-group domain-containing protein [Thermoanaerobaculia bacterium]
MRFGEFELDAGRHRLTRSGEEVPLEPKVFALIAYLARNGDRVVPKQELLDALWEEKFVTESALTRVVRDARRALGDSPSSPTFIRTMYGKGFLFVADVDARDRRPREASSVPARPSIAVLPFEDLSEDRSQAHFCEGLADEIINALARIETLDVSSRRLSFEAARRNPDPCEAARMLGATTVLEGSVRRSGDRMRVTVHLVDVATGHSRWSERYDREVGDVFAVQEDIAEQTATALVGLLGESERRMLHQRPHPGMHAWELYLKGRALYYQDSPPTHEAARQLYERAIELEPGFALGWAGIAVIVADQFLFFRRSEEYRDEAERTSLRALELDESLPDAHTSRGLALTTSGRYDDAVTSFETAIALDPRGYDAHYHLGRLLWTMNRREQAIAHLERAAAVRTDDHIAPMLLVQAYYGVGRESDRHNAALRALALLARRLELRPDEVRTVCFSAEAHYAIGERETAMRLIDDAYRIDPRNVCTLYNSACVFALDGQSGRAIDAIAGAVREGYANREWLACDPDFTALAGDPRFRAIVDSLQAIVEA